MPIAPVGSQRPPRPAAPTITTNDAPTRQPPTPTHGGYPAGGRRFDWAIVALGGWLIGGVHLDGWAHNHHPDLETFFTPWHAVLYSGFFALFLTLLFIFARNLGRGYPWQRALPVGYNLSLIGTCVFLIGGGLDLIWHQIFGIEANTEALLSPTHLILATGGILMVSGPLRAAWQRPAMLPALLALTFVVALLAFFTQFAHPQVDTLATERITRAQPRGDLYTMRRDGSRQTRLTTNPNALSRNGAWSPDGNAIAFETGGKNVQIVVMNADGSNLIRLTDTKGNNSNPTWSPDGRKIAFASTRDGNGAIYVMNAGGANQTRLTTGAANAFFPVWSPDGQKIAYHTNRDGKWAIYTMNPDGSAQTRVTTSSGNDFFPTWSPDSAWLAFASTRDGHDEIYMSNADGSNPTRLTFGKADNWEPSWSPDGRAIAFISTRDTNAEVYVMNADGSGQTNLSHNPGVDNGRALSWSPDGSGLLYTVEIRSGSSSWQAVNLGVASILLQAILLSAALLFLVRRWPILPFGSFAVVFGLVSLCISFMHDRFVFIPAAILAGLAADILRQRLRPTTARIRMFHLFAFAVPAVFYALYFAALALTDGIGWSVHLWVGAIFMAGIAGLLLSYLIAPRTPRADGV